jgi:hypothetical protein
MKLVSPSVTKLTGPDEYSQPPRPRTRAQSGMERTKMGFIATTTITTTRVKNDLIEHPPSRSPGHSVLATGADHRSGGSKLNAAVVLAVNWHSSSVDMRSHLNLVHRLSQTGNCLPSQTASATFFCAIANCVRRPCFGTLPRLVSWKTRVCDRTPARPCRFWERGVPVHRDKERQR